MNDIIYMKKALMLAKKGQFSAAPNPNVGCVIVKNGKIIGEGWHIRQGEPHAEINALKKLTENAYGATVYINLEPCSHFGYTPPCCKSLVLAGIKRIVIAMIDPNPLVSGKGIKYMKKHGISISCGLMKKEAESINKGFNKRMKTGLPWIQLKMASSIDGKISMSDGNSKWISSVESRKDVQYFRAKNQVILSTSKTIIKDNPSLNVRYSDMNQKTQSYFLNAKIKQPIRLIIDSNNHIKPFHNVIQTQGKVLLARLKPDKEKWPKNTKQIIIDKDNNNKIDLLSLIYKLGSKKVNNVWVEAGSQLAGSLINIKLVDELIIYLSPKILGEKSKDIFTLKKTLKISETIDFRFKKIKRIGKDLRIILKPKLKSKSYNKEKYYEKKLS
ncbi:bifunctional diaminohydroxyphosphoribosylaminopyrimidine deaminase/5-amino-6-(5-phosphoribosylamino)uracil reductase RibD [Buchnera aphidicola (Neophyllaphis varicolor)]|uniref:bifunctional diaminohydroxyphosphoribosylaminopyrimidine deaminase/5-amino-6-(5-phosphoribosylamino)uracil reductase RibD n=1 Tax=Buchnera aphidicola TaxID=9 RepID=UPI0031B84FE5